MATRERLTEQVKEYLTGKNIQHMAAEKADATVFRFQMGIKGMLSSVNMNILVRDGQIQCIAASPIKAKQENCGNIVEFLTRANYGLNIGGFDFDYSDGEIRYRDCLPVHSEEAVPADIETMVLIPMMMMQRYGDGLVKNVMGLGNPEEDVAEARSR